MCLIKHYRRSDFRRWPGAAQEFEYLVQLRLPEDLRRWDGGYTNEGKWDPQRIQSQQQVAEERALAPYRNTDLSKLKVAALREILTTCHIHHTGIKKAGLVTCLNERLNRGSAGDGSGGIGGGGGGIGGGIGAGGGHGGARGNGRSTSGSGRIGSSSGRGSSGSGSGSSGSSGSNGSSSSSSGSPSPSGSGSGSSSSSGSNGSDRRSGSGSNGSDRRSGSGTMLTFSQSQPAANGEQNVHHQLQAQRRVRKRNRPQEEQTATNNCLQCQRLQKFCDKHSA